MSVSRRSFLQGLGRTTRSAEFMAARGHEEYVAELLQQGGPQGGRSMRPQLPPGTELIRISSNENPLGPGKAAIDAILGKFPEANRYPFNSTPLDADLEILLAKLNAAKRENIVLGVGSQETAAQRGARVHVADQAPGRSVADVRQLLGAGAPAGLDDQDGPSRRAS